MKLRPSTLAIVATLATAAVACGSAPQTTDTAAQNDRNTGAAHQGRSGVATSGGDNGAGACNVSAVYFAFDSSDLDGRARSTLEQNARCINQRDARARVVGMTDPRGTEEYNLALGDRRARSVSSYMSNLGVDQGRVNVRSVGEEQARGNDERGWAEDRRADIQLQ